MHKNRFTSTLHTLVHVVQGCFAASTQTVAVYYRCRALLLLSPSVRDNLFLPCPCLKRKPLIIAVKTRRRIYYFVDIRGDEEDIFAHISRTSNSSGSRPVHGQAPVLLLAFTEWASGSSLSFRCMLCPLGHRI